MLWVLVCGLLIPLSVLDARIERYEIQLATRNLTLGSRCALQQSLGFHRRERYKILEQIEEADLDASF